MKYDIENREDVAVLVNTFYKRVLKDKLIQHFFTEVVKLQWEKHIPVIIDFWSSILFDEQSFRGNPMIKHIELSRQHRLEKKHFDRWLLHWNKTVDQLFQGENADLAKARALSIGLLMQSKIEANF